MRGEWRYGDHVHGIRLRLKLTIQFVALSGFRQTSVRYSWVKHEIAKLVIIFEKILESGVFAITCRSALYCGCISVTDSYSHTWTHILASRTKSPIEVTANDTNKSTGITDTEPSPLKKKLNIVTHILSQARIKEVPHLVHDPVRPPTKYARNGSPY